MPWCEGCSRFYNPNSMAPDGTCATCGAFIAEPPEGGEQAAHVPWHFWILVLALALYLGWRLVQGLAWIADKL